MRASSALAAVALAGCMVPDKSAPGDAGADAGIPPDAAGVVDDDPPETTIVAGPDELTRAAGSTFQFTADEAATFSCSFDGEPAFDCESPLTRTLPDASHTFSVRATDLAGNVDESPAEHVWTIDTEPPSTTITAAPPAADNSVVVHFEFVSNDDAASFDCALDGDDFAPCASGDGFGPLDDGAHGFAVRARDVAGNVDTTPAMYAWAIDSSTPDTEILTGPEGAVATGAATFTFMSPDARAGATFDCRIDGGAFAPCTSPRTFAGLGEGEHTFAVRVRDSVGNLDPTPATRTWRVDLTAPDTSFTSGPEGTVAMASASFALAASEAVAGYECALDGAVWAACANPATVTGLSQGPHTFRARAIDLAGHVDPTPATRTWTVDTVGPVVAITAGPAGGSTSGPYVSFSFTVSEGTPSCSVDGGAFAPCTSPAAYNLAAGSHSFAVRASDAVGNPSTATRGWTVACAPPGPTGAAGLFHLDEASGQTATNAAGGADAVLGSDATEETADPARLATARFGAGLTFDAAEDDRLTWAAGLGPDVGTHTIELWVRPAAGSGSDVLVVSADSRIALRVDAGSSDAQIVYSVVDGGGTGHTVTSPDVAVGQWHHVLASFEEPAMRLWVNGVVEGATGVAAGSTISGDSFVLGAGFAGDLDEVVFAESAITTDDAARARYCPP